MIQNTKQTGKKVSSAKKSTDAGDTKTTGDDSAGDKAEKTEPEADVASDPNVTPEAEVIADVEHPNGDSNPPVVNPADEVPAKDTEKDSLIEAAVTKINELVGDNLLKTAMDVGNYILETFYNNDIQEALSKNPKKHNSYRKLQDSLDLKIHFKTLNQMVNITIQERFLLAKFSEDKLKLLSYSQRVELLPRNDDDKVTLAEKCFEEQLTIKQMRSAISKTKPKTDNRNITIASAIIRNIITKYSKKNLSTEDFSKLPLGKLETMHTDIETFEKEMGLALAQLAIIKKQLMPVYLEKSKPKEPKPPGRPKKK